MSILSIDNVSVKFPGMSLPALNSISCDIRKNDFIILLGSNGSGKSTLLKLLHRERSPDEGSISLMNRDIAEYNDQDFSRHVSVLTQNSSESLFSSLTVYENYLLVANNTQANKDFFNAYIADFNPNLSHKLDITINELSGGEKQALALALCLLTPPSILLLDEHTSALDPKTSALIMSLTQKMLEKYSMTCILTTHNLDIAVHYGNRILVLSDGNVKRDIDQSDKRHLKKEDMMSICF